MALNNTNIDSQDLGRKGLHLNARGVGKLATNLINKLRTFSILIDQHHQHLGFGKGMTIPSLNVNGIRRHFDEIQNILSSLGIHILALNENMLDEKHPEELTDITGYQQVRLDKTYNGGGVSIYVRESIKIRTHSDVPKNDLELICVEIKSPKSKPFLVLAWYKNRQVPLLMYSLSWRRL